MALNLTHGITLAGRQKRKTKSVELTTWSELPTYFTKKLAESLGKLVRTTVYAKSNWPGQYELEARMMFANSNVPLGYVPGTENEAYSVPCKDTAQGKKQLIEFIENLENDEETQRIVAQWFAHEKRSNLKFDVASIPPELLRNY